MPCGVGMTAQEQANHSKLTPIREEVVERWGDLTARKCVALTKSRKRNSGRRTRSIISQQGQQSCTSSQIISPTPLARRHRATRKLSKWGTAGGVRNAIRASLLLIIGLSFLRNNHSAELTQFKLMASRYIMSLAVADWSGQAWLQGFNDVGVAVFGMPANELVEIKVRQHRIYLSGLLTRPSLGTG